MSRRSPSTYLEHTLELLVEHFGAGRVRSALAKVSNGTEVGPGPTHQREMPKRREHEHPPSITETLEQLRHNDLQKHQLLSGFHARLKDKAVLPESQDIRHFAQLIGLKAIDGKSRKDMIPRLMRALLQRSNERLQSDIDAAATISEQQRQQGFSILTDKILSGTVGHEGHR